MINLRGDYPQEIVTLLSDITGKPREDAREAMFLAFLKEVILIRKALEDRRLS